MKNSLIPSGLIQRPEIPSLLLLLLLLFRAPFREIKHLLRILSLLAATVGTAGSSWVGHCRAIKGRERKRTAFTRSSREGEETKKKKKEEEDEKEASSSTLVHLAWSPVHRLQSSVEISSRPWSTKLLLLSKSLELAPLTSSDLLARSERRGESVHAYGARGRGKKDVVKPRLQIYDIELEVEGGPSKRGPNKIWWPGGTS